MKEKRAETWQHTNKICARLLKHCICACIYFVAQCFLKSQLLRFLLETSQRNVRKLHSSSFLTEPGDLGERSDKPELRNVQTSSECKQHICIYIKS